MKNTIIKTAIIPTAAMGEMQSDARVLLKSNRYAALFRQGGRYVLGLKMADGTLCCSEYVTRSEAEDMYRYVSNKLKNGEEV